jgi:hypothetical protein
MTGDRMLSRSDGTAYFYDRAGNPLTDYDEIERLLIDREYKRVGGDTVLVDGKTLAVSTVWLGVNHNFTADGPPLIFETMVFGDPPLAENACWRYATEDEARRGHEKAVEALRFARLTNQNQITDGRPQ